MELIDRQVAIDALVAEARIVDSHYLEFERIIHEDDAIEAISMLPSVEPRIIHCKDCVYYEQLNNNEYYCDAIYRDLHGDDEGVTFEPPEDYFCAYGIRREANEH